MAAIACTKMEVNKAHKKTWYHISESEKIIIRKAVFTNKSLCLQSGVILS
jgi:hypothetical protein